MAGKIESILNEFDKKLIRNAKMIIISEGEDPYPIPFQFPPRILSDSKKPQYQEIPTYSYEPIKIYIGSDSRAFTVEFDYIATGEQFNVPTISDILRQIKSSIYNGTNAGPQIKCSIYEIAPKELPCRLMGIDIKHSEELVDNGGIFPLHTKVSLQLEMQTRIGFLSTHKEGDQNVVDDIPKLIIKPDTPVYPFKFWF